MVRYRYASCNGEVVDIAQVDERMRAASSFVCFSCGGAMVARLGEQVERHFAHHSTGTCRSETYLHQAGKRLFLDRYRQGGVVLHYPVDRVCGRHEALLGAPCVVGTEWRMFELTERFTTWEQEERDGRWVPDVCLIDDRGEKIYVEIAVTHRCSAEKIASGVRIIEFLVETEADLALLGRGDYTLGREDRVRFYNFSPPRVSCLSEGCVRRFWVLEVFSSGRVRWGLFLASELSGVAVYRRVYDRSVGFRVALGDALSAGVVVRDCLLCVHADIHRRVVRGVWCRFLGRVCGSLCVHYQFCPRGVIAP